MAPTPATTGLLLVGHGTRSDAGTRQFRDLADRLAERVGPVPVEPCFLELAEPRIDQAVCRLVERGARRLTVVPLLLFAAGHAKRDIPEAVRAALDGLEAASVEVAQSDHLGCHPAIVDLSIRRGGECLAPKPAVPPTDTCLLLVGRGSRDASATAEMHQFAHLRHRAEIAGTTEVAFLAMAKPPLAEMLPRIAQHGYRRVIVQPHLLFEGDLADSLRRSVADIAAQHPAQEWLVTPLLADPPDHTSDATERLLTALLDRMGFC